MPIWLLLLLGGGLAAIAVTSTSKPAKPTLIRKPGLPFKAPSASPGMALRPNYPSYAENVAYPTGTPLPPGSPTGSPWVVWYGNRNMPFAIAPADAGFGLDRDGKWWLYLEPYYWAPCKYEGCLKPAGEPEDSWFNKIAMKVGQALVPILSVAATALVPGIGGILSSAAIKARADIAQGGKINDAVIGAARNALPSLLGSDEFNRASELLKKTVPQSVLVEARKRLATPQQRSAFDSAVIFDNAKTAQNVAIDKLKKTFPAQADKIQYAFDNGAQVVDIANAYGGDKGVLLVNKTISTAPKYVVSTK